MLLQSSAGFHETVTALFSAVGSSYLQDFIEYIILPALSLLHTGASQQQAEVAAMLFTRLRSQQKWLLTYQILNKCARSLIESSRHLPLPLQSPLQALLLPNDAPLVKASPQEVGMQFSSFTKDTHELGVNSIN